MNQKIEELLEQLPSKEYDKALKYYNENNIEALKEYIEEFIFKVKKSLEVYGKHSKYYAICSIKDLEKLSNIINDEYYEYLNQMDYLLECEKREFDENYLDYE